MGEPESDQSYTSYCDGWGFPNPYPKGGDSEIATYQIRG